MSKVSDNVAKWKTDSFRVELPLESVKVDSRFTDRYQLLNLNTGELEDFEKKQALQLELNGVNYYSWLYERYSPNTKIKTKYLAFLVNSKMLYSDYFRGITNDTIFTIYNQLMSLGHFEFTFEQFINAYVYDIDFCCDYYCDYGSKMWFYKKYTYTNRYKVVPFIRHDVLQTLQFQKRDTSTNSAPYAKYYSKWHEAFAKVRNTKKFYKENQIDINDIYELYRFEYTMKNNKMLKKYHGVENRLSDILNISDYQHQQTAENIHLIYTDGYRTQLKNSDYTAIPRLLDFIIQQSDLQPNELTESLKEFLSLTDEEGNGTTDRTRQRVVKLLRDKLTVVQPKIVIPEDRKRGVEKVEWTLFGKSL